MVPYELDTLTLHYVDEADTAANRNLYGPVWLSFYNRAYSDLCRNKIKPETGELVTLDANKCYTVTGTAKKIRQPVFVSQYEDFSAGANGGLATRYKFYWKSRNVLVVPDAEASAQVWLQYEYWPTPLTNDDPDNASGSTTEPDELDEDKHGVLSMFAAASEWRIRRKFEREAAWMNAFAAAIQDIEPRREERKLTISNTVPPMPMM